MCKSLSICYARYPLRMFLIWVVGMDMALLFAGGLECVGIGPAIKPLKFARATAEFLQGYGDDLPFIKECFHAVIIKYVVHHVSHPKKVLLEARRCLRAGGYLCLLEPVEYDPVIRFSRSLYPYWEGMRVETSLMSVNWFSLLMNVVL